MGHKVSQLGGSRSYDSRLFRAIERGDMATIRYLVEKQVDVNRVENKHTPLNLALHRRNTDAVKLLLQHGESFVRSPSPDTRRADPGPWFLGDTTKSCFGRKQHSAEIQRNKIS